MNQVDLKWILDLKNLGLFLSQKTFGSKSLWKVGFHVSPTTFFHVIVSLWLEKMYGRCIYIYIYLYIYIYICIFWNASNIVFSETSSELGVKYLYLNSLGDWEKKNPWRDGDVLLSTTCFLFFLAIIESRWRWSKVIYFWCNCQVPGLLT